MQINQPLKKGIVIIATFALGAGTAPRLSAQGHQATEPHGWINTETVKTPFGDFEFKNGYPAGNSAERLLEQLKLNRAIEVYLNLIGIAQKLCVAFAPELTQGNGSIATISLMTRSLNSGKPAHMDEEREPGKTEQEYAEEIYAAVTKGRDIALQAHLVFVTEHTTSTEFMHHADKLNDVLAELNKMIDKPPE